MLYVMVVIYTNKHITFNKGKCIGHMELLIDRMSQTSVTSVTTQKTMDGLVQLDTFTPPLHQLSSKVKQPQDELLDSFKSQFTRNKSSIGTTNLAKMQIDTDNSDPALQKPYPIAMKHYELVKDEINKF